MKKKDKYIVIFIAVFSSFLILFLIYKTINELKYRKGKPEEIIYTSNINSDTKYLVYLKNNPFIDKEYLSSDLSYITSLVDSINLKYNYQYDNDKILSLNYQYWIEARIISEYISEGTQNLKNPIWDKSFNLTDVVNGDTSTGKINFELGSTINFEYYSNMVKEFTNNLSIGTNSRLEISLIVKINNDSLNKQYKTTMQIPLGVKAFDINIYKDFSEQEIVYNKEQKEEVSYVTAIIYIILIIIIVFISYYLIKKIINCQKNKCLLRVKKILKEYDDRIITVTNFIDYSKLDVVRLSSFEELINLYNETYEPIIYWEKSSNRNFEGWFAIVKNKIVYIYTISCLKNNSKCSKC